MKKILLASILIAQVMVQGTAWCAVEITPNSKTKSTITATVKPFNVIDVTSAQGNWPDPLELEQLGAFGSPFEAKFELKVFSSPAKFQVKLEAAPTLIHASKRFRSVEVSLEPLTGGGVPQVIPVTPNKIFLTNPAPIPPVTASIGHYMLKIRAQPPDGKLHEIGGTYTGRLSMTFEPVAQQP